MNPANVVVEPVVNNSISQKHTQYTTSLYCDCMDRKRYVNKLPFFITSSVSACTA